jgi:hypothetical protein
MIAVVRPKKGDAMAERDRRENPDPVSHAQTPGPPAPQGNNDTDAVNSPRPDEETIGRISEKYQEAAAKAREHERKSKGESSVALPR